MPARRAINARFNPFSAVWTPNQIENEHHTVRNLYVQLFEAPDSDYALTVTDILTAVNMTQVTGSPAAGEYRADLTYGTGLLQFHSSHNDKDVDVDYYGKGSPVVANDHNFGGGGFRSAFRAGFGGDGSDGASTIAASFEFTKTVNQFTSLVINSTVTVGTTAGGVLILGVQGRLSLSDDACFNLAGLGAAQTLAGGVGNSDPVFGFNAADQNPGQAVESYAGGGGGGYDAGAGGPAGMSGGGGILGGWGSATSGALRKGKEMPTPYVQISEGAEITYRSRYSRFLSGRPLGVGGSGGGGISGGKGGAGGGALVIECDELYLSDAALKSGWANVAGQNGTNTSLGYGGGGGGGTIFIVCNRIIKSTDNAATRQLYLYTQANLAGGSGSGANAGDGGRGFMVVIELDPSGRD